MMMKMIQETLEKKLKEKDEDIQCSGKLNWMLQEIEKNLNTDKQMWKELAQNDLK